MKAKSKSKKLPLVLISDDYAMFDITHLLPKYARDLRLERLAAPVKTLLFSTEILAGTLRLLLGFDAEERMLFQTPLTWGENIPADLVKELEAIKEPFLADLKERLELVNIKVV